MVGKEQIFETGDRGWETRNRDRTEGDLGWETKYKTWERGTKDVRQGPEEMGRGMGDMGGEEKLRNACDVPK
jgi:hypothetical protein